MTILALSLLAVLVPLVLVDLVRRTESRRLVWRHLTGRPAETALVAGGSMLATALIVGSMVGGNSFEDSLVRWAADDLGTVDEVVVLDDPTDLGTAVAALVDVDVIDDVAALSITGARLQDGSLVDLATVTSATTDSELGIGGSLAPGTAVVSDAVASDLGLGVGDELRLDTAAGPWVVQIASVEKATAALAFAPVLVDAGTAASLGPENFETRLLVSNLGGVLDGAEHTEAATAAASVALLDAGLEGLVVDPVKQDWLDAAKVEGDDLTSLFGTVGGFGVAAGVLLIVNLFVMLADERRSELGALRAIGFGRARLIRILAAEGLAHGLLAAGVGAIAGIGVGAAIVAGANAALVDGGDAQVSLSVRPAALFAGAAIGLAISQLTVVATAIRAGRVEIVSALADREPAPRPERPWRARLIGVLAVAIASGMLAIGSDEALVLLAAPVLGALGLGPWLAVVVGRSRATTSTTAVAAIWSVAVFELGGKAMDHVEVTFFLAEGLLAIGLAVRLLVRLDPLWHRLGRTKVGLAVRLGLLEPLEKRGRTSLLITMYALVVFTVTFVSVLGETFASSSPALAEQAGGRFDAVADLAPGTTSAASFAAGVDLTARPDIVGVVAAERLSVDLEDGEPIRISLLDPAAFGADGVGPDLEAWSPGYEDAEAVWEAVAAAADSGSPLLIAGDDDGWVVGDTIVFDGPGGAVPIEVAAIARHVWLTDSGVYVPASLAGDLLGRPMRPNRLWIDTVEGSDIAEVAGLPELRLSEVEGMVEIAEAETESSRSFMGILNGYLSVGLVVGVAGLAVVLVRSVRERRRTLAVLRALGISPGVIRRSFLVEGTLVGAQGVATGLGLGLLTSWLALTRSGAFEEDLTWVLPGTQLALLTAVTVLASGLAAIGPSVRAGRVPPAAALRV